MRFSFCGLFSQFWKWSYITGFNDGKEPKTVFQEVKLISGIYNHWLFMAEENSTAYSKT